MNMRTIALRGRYNAACMKMYNAQGVNPFFDAL